MSNVKINELIPLQIKRSTYAYHLRIVNDFVEDTTPLDHITDFQINFSYNELEIALKRHIHFGNRVVLITSNLNEFGESQTGIYVSGNNGKYNYELKFISVSIFTNDRGVRRMNNIDTFNSCVLVFLTIFLMVYVPVGCLTGKFFARDTRYVPLNKVVKLGIPSLLLLILEIWFLSQFYIALSQSHISLEKLGDDSLIVAIFLTSAMLVSIVIICMFLTLIKTIKMLIIYINLKKDNIPNNLRHALYKRNFESIINNYKLLIMSDEKVSLSNEEILQLSAVLSNSGMYEDVQAILKTKLFKKETFLNDIFSVFPNQPTYKLQCSSEDIEYNDELKTALQKHDKVFRYVYILMIIIAIFQIFISIKPLIINTSQITSGRIAILIIAVIINFVIVLKYRILKTIYQKSLNISDVKIKSSKIDKVIFICQSTLIVATIIGLLTTLYNRVGE